MVDELHAAGFRDVDATADPARFIRSMQASSESAFMRDRARDRLARSELPQRGIVADLGCGLGGDTLMLARHVATGGGRAIGLDRSETMLGFARARGDAAGLPVEFRQGDVLQLPFSDSELDGCWMERVLIHVEDPARTLTEMSRVLRPGGQAVVFEPDYRSYLLDAPDAEVSELVAACLAAKHRNPTVGSTLLRLALDAGFTSAKVIPEVMRFPGFEWTAAGLILRDLLDSEVQKAHITTTRAEAWWNGLQAADARGAFLCVITAFTLVATR